MKVSEIFHRVDESGKRVGTVGRIPHDLGFYRTTLERIWDVFGADRLIFASDWTTSEPMGTFAETIGIVREFFTAKGSDAAEKFFWKNSARAYRWVKRRPDQPQSALV